MSDRVYVVTVLCNIILEKATPASIEVILPYNMQKTYNIPSIISQKIDSVVNQLPTSAGRRQGEPEYGPKTSQINVDTINIK